MPSLPVPDPDAEIDPAELVPIDSVRLFVERAQAVDPTFVAHRRERGGRRPAVPSPRRAAAGDRARRVARRGPAGRGDRRSAGRSLPLLVGGSRTALSRQQTLKATLDWSYNLLTDPQRRVLRALSVFVGGAPLEAAEVVCPGEGVGSGDVLGLLGELVDQSLVALDDAVAEPRYRLLETVREYGRRSS